MSKIAELIEKRNQVARDMEEMVNSSKTNDTEWTSEHQEKFVAAGNIWNRLDSQIRVEQIELDKEAERAHGFEIADRSDFLGRKTPEQREQFNMFSNWIRGGAGKLSDEEMVVFTNTMSTTTGSEGGFTVPSMVNPQYIEVLKSFGAMRRLATVIPTATGAPFPFPKSDGTAEEGEIVAENATAGNQDPAFSSVPLNVFMYSSKTITIPMQLIQDSAIDVVGFVGNRLVKRVGRITNRHYTTGTGTGQPWGVAVAASAGAVGATGNTTDVPYNSLVDLVESLDIEYHQGASFMFGQAIRGTLRKKVDSQNRPIWLPGYDSGMAAPVPDRLLGFPVEINNYMPSPGANAKSIAFGDMSTYVIRDVGAPEIQRYDDSAFARNRQLGYQMWMRTGGNLTDTAAVKLYQHSAT